MENKLLRYRKDRIVTFVDYETQNLALHYSWNLPWECAIIKTNGHDILEEYVAYIKWNPLLKISEGAVRATRYNPFKIEKEGKDPEEVFNVVDKYLRESDYVSGHNLISFDEYVNQSFAKKLNKQPYSFISKVLDTNALLKGLLLEQKYKPQQENLIDYQYRMDEFVRKGLKSNLSLAAKRYNIVVDELRRHEALYDLQINFQVFKEIINEQDI